MHININKFQNDIFDLLHIIDNEKDQNTPMLYKDYLLKNDDEIYKKLQPFIELQKYFNTFIYSLNFNRKLFHLILLLFQAINNYRLFFIFLNTG